MRFESMKLAINNTAMQFESNPNFEICVRDHYQILIEQYSRRPYFYKNTLKYSRLMVSLAMLSEYFSQPSPLLSSVKELCESRGYCSKNSIESTFLALSALGFIHVKPLQDDGRFRTFSPSDEACADIRKVMSSITSPLTLLCPSLDAAQQLEHLDHKMFLRLYFEGFSTLLHNNLTIDELLPECCWLIKRDAGHMLMLSIYNDRSDNSNRSGNFRSSSYLTLATELSVSKTHVIRLVKEGSERGLFRIHSKTELELLSPFFKLVRKFMALTFSIGFHSVCPDTIKKIIGAPNL